MGGGGRSRDQVDSSVEGFAPQPDPEQKSTLLAGWRGGCVEW